MDGVNEGMWVRHPDVRSGQRVWAELIDTENFIYDFVGRCDCGWRTGYHLEEDAVLNELATHVTCDTR